MKNYKISHLVFILTPFVLSFAFGLDIYIPIVPQMAQIFDTTPAWIQLTLSLFLFTTGVGQLVIGPLSDQFGRKSIFFVSSALFAVGSLSCAFSPHIFWLIFARFVTSLGACGMLVNAFAIVRDLFSNEQSAKMYSFLNGAIGVSPTSGPIIGGYLAMYFGWHSIFIFLTLLGLLSFFVTTYYVQETHEKEKRIKIDKEVIKRYWQVFTHRQFIIYATIAGLADAILFCFFLTSPFIIIDLLGVPTDQFGYYFAVFGGVIALGGFISGKCVEKMGIQLTMGIGMGLMMGGGILMLGWHYVYALSLAGYLIPMAIACMGGMFLIGASASVAMEPFGAIAGTAAAAFGSMEFGISAIVGVLMMLFPITNTVPYGVSIVILSVLSISLFLMRHKVFDSKTRMLKYNE